jgi:hypothetical protein
MQRVVKVGTITVWKEDTIAPSIVSGPPATSPKADSEA